MNVYAVSDLHGYLNFYKQIKNFIKPEDIVYFLGDASGRGPQPWELVKTIAQDPQFIYIKGNHEQMIAEAMEETINDFKSTYAIQLCAINDETKTLLQWEHETGGTQGWMKYLYSLPWSETYINKNGQKVILCHAGFTPGKPNRRWDREHVGDEWPEVYDNTIIVHGHIPTLIPGYPKVYANGHKYNIDRGCFHYPHECCLLDLDAFEEHTFTLGDDSNECKY